MGLSNPLFVQHMDALFGPKRSSALRARLGNFAPQEREIVIIEEVVKALQELGGRFVLPFRFRNERGVRTSHYLVFVSKKFKGYEIMKNIMAKQSSTESQGVPSFEYSPADERCPLLFELARPLDDLQDGLLKYFAGQTLKMRKIYERHSIGLPFVERNYKNALIELETEGRITAEPPASERPKRDGRVTFGPTVVVTFPIVEE